MGKTILELILKVTDEASKELAKIEGEGGIKGLTKGLTSMINPAALASAGIAAVGTAVVATYAKFSEHVTAVSDFASMIGATTEEASVFIQMSEDFDITMDTMLAAFRTMAQNGVEPTIEGMEKLRKEYVAIQDPVKRLTWAQKNLGEQGIKQILPMWDRLGDSMLNYGNQMEDSKIITQEMVDLNNANKESFAELGNMVEGAMIKIGSGVAELLNKWIFPAIEAFDNLYQVIMHITGIKEIVPEMAVEGLETSVELAEEFGIIWPEVIGQTREAFGALEGEIYDVWGAYSVAGTYYNETALQMLARIKELDAATADFTEREALLMAVNEMIAGNYLVAQFYVDLAYEIEQGTTAADLLNAELERQMQLLDDLDGRTITNTVITQFVQSGKPALRGPSGAGATDGGGSSIQGADGNWYGPAVVKGGYIWTVAPHAYPGNTGVKPKGYQFGGEFTVGGFGGTDSELVSFAATPGEKVTVGNKEDKLLLKEMKGLRRGIDRLGRIIPVAIRDAVERVQ